MDYFPSRFSISPTRLLAPIRNKSLLSHSSPTYLLYDRIISNCVFRRAYASGDLDANLVSGDGMVGFDGLAHGIGGLESGSRVSFAGRGLDGSPRRNAWLGWMLFGCFSVVTKAPVSKITFKWAWRQLSLISCNSSVNSSKLSSMK